MGVGLDYVPRREGDEEEGVLRCRCSSLLVLLAAKQAIRWKINKNSSTPISTVQRFLTPAAVTRGQSLFLCLCR